MTSTRTADSATTPTITRAVASLGCRNGTSEAAWRRSSDREGHTEPAAKPTPQRDDGSSGRYTPPIPKAVKVEPAVGADPDVRPARHRLPDDHAQLPRGPARRSQQLVSRRGPRRASSAASRRRPSSADGCPQRWGQVWGSSHRCNFAATSTAAHSARLLDRRDEVHVLLAVAGRIGQLVAGERHLHLGPADRAPVLDVHPAHLARGRAAAGGGSGVPSPRGAREPDDRSRSSQTIVPNNVPTTTIQPRDRGDRAAARRRNAPRSTTRAAR